MSRAYLWHVSANMQSSSYVIHSRTASAVRKGELTAISTMMWKDCSYYIVADNDIGRYRNGFYSQEECFTNDDFDEHSRFYFHQSVS